VLRALALVFVLPLVAAGCFFPAGNGNGDGGSSQNGFTAPTLMVTAGGLRVGPVAPDPGSFADLVDEKNAVTGRVVSSKLSIVVSGGGASCQLYGERAGDGVFPFFATAYTLMSQVSATTGDGTASPGAGERIATAQSSWRCVGNGCNGAQLFIRALDATHIEGFVSGTFESEQVGGYFDSAVCSFWLPMRTYQR
jgi:hypothetical protein